MNSYFKDVNELAGWLAWTEHAAPHRESFVRIDQLKRVNKALEEGGHLLSYIKGIKCWAGVFKIVGTTLRKSQGNTSWEKEFPYYFEVEPIHELRSPEKCFLVRESRIGTGHDGRGIYNHILDVEVCERICSRIKVVANITEKEAKVEALASSEFEDFKSLWHETLERSTFQTRVAIKHAGGRCSICGVTKQEWIDRIQKSGKWPEALGPIERIRDSRFEMLHGHHHKSVKDGGDARLDNLGAVCPNCHDLLTRGGSQRSPR